MRTGSLVSDGAHLVKQQPVNVVRRQARIIKCLLEHLRHTRRRELVHLLAVHRDGRVGAFCDGRGDCCPEVLGLAVIAEVKVGTACPVGVHLVA